jgi:ABC-type sugar transport system substrate-binding protein
MSTNPLALCLVDADNDFQQAARLDAEDAARGAGLSIETHWSGGDLSAQLAQVRQLLDRTSPPAAILIMAVRDRGLARLAAEAAGAAIHWVFLNRTEDDLDDVRRVHPRAIVCQIYPDEVETGRVQGRLVQALLPNGGRVLQVEGSRRSLAARDRTAGTLQVLAGGPVQLVPLEAGWTAEEGREAVRGWLRVAVRANVHLDLVLCHNDLLAVGAREALEEVARTLERPGLTTLPIVGCDGTPSVGQKMVEEGRIAATVVLPRSSRTAVELVARALAGGEPPPAVVTLRASAFPEVEMVSHHRGPGPGKGV